MGGCDDISLFANDLESSMGMEDKTAYVCEGLEHTACTGDHPCMASRQYLSDCGFAPTAALHIITKRESRHKKQSTASFPQFHKKCLEKCVITR